MVNISNFIDIDFFLVLFLFCVAYFCAAMSTVRPTSFDRVSPRLTRWAYSIPWSTVRSSCLIGYSSDLQGIRSVIKSRMSSISGQIGPFASEELALERRKKNSPKHNGENIVRKISPSLLIVSSSNLQVTGIAIKSRTISNSCPIHYPLRTYLPLGAEKPKKQNKKNNNNNKKKQTNTIFDLVRSIAFLILIGSLLDLQIIRTGIKSRTSSNSGQIGILILKLLVL